jgi:hypothetical protein
MFYCEVVGALALAVALSLGDHRRDATSEALSDIARGARMPYHRRATEG